jgi:hypothetical protein
MPINVGQGNLAAMHVAAGNAKHQSKTDLFRQLKKEGQWEEAQRFFAKSLKELLEHGTDAIAAEKLATHATSIKFSKAHRKEITPQTTEPAILTTEQLQANRPFPFLWQMCEMTKKAFGYRSDAERKKEPFQFLAAIAKEKLSRKNK